MAQGLLGKTEQNVAPKTKNMCDGFLKGQSSEILTPFLVIFG